MKRMIDFDTYDNLCDTVYRMKQSVLLLDLVLKHLETHRESRESWLSVEDFKDELQEEIFDMAVFVDNIGKPQTDDVLAVEQRADIA